jgi:hypothetical protein
MHRVIVANSPSGIADGDSLSLICGRRPQFLPLMMDGSEMVRQIVSDLPLRLRGKGMASDDDGFHGVLDVVFVEIG